MAKLPAPASPTVEAIYQRYVALRGQQPRRGYLGGSSIGRECARELWYQFRWAFDPAVDGRMERLFMRGHREEPVLIADLRAIGVEVLEQNEATGRQWRFTAHGGHFGGGLDAVVRGLLEAPKTWALAEFKTSNVKGYKALRKHGVARAKPQHFAQMQVYMGLAGLKRAAYFAVCKDTDAIYFEWVHFDQKIADRYMERALQIIEATQPLSRYSLDPFSPPCGWCDALDICHEGKAANVNCRTCAHATPDLTGDNGRWLCELTGDELSRKAQARGCPEHLYIPALVPFAEPVESGPGFVLYQLRRKGGGQFANVSAGCFPAPEGVPQYSSTALEQAPAEAIGTEVFEAARDVFGPEWERVDDQPNESEG